MYSEDGTCNDYETSGHNIGGVGRKNNNNNSILIQLYRAVGSQK